MVATERVPFFQIFAIIFRNPFYVFPMLSLAILFFNVNGITTWYADYMKIGLGVDEGKVNIAFSLVTVTGPVFGCLAGGILSSYLGGYANPLSTFACFIETILAAACGFPLPFITNFYYFVFFLWFQLFFGGMLMPGTAGMIVNANKKEYKAIASSVA